MVAERAAQRQPGRRGRRHLRVWRATRAADCRSAMRATSSPWGITTTAAGAGASRRSSPTRRTATRLIRSFRRLPPTFWSSTTRSVSSVQSSTCRSASCRCQLWANYAQNMASGRRGGYGVRRRFPPRARRATPGPGRWPRCTSPSTRTRCSASSWTRTSATARPTPRAGCCKAAMRRCATSPSTCTYFMNTINKDVGTELDYNRLQLDLNWKY